MSTAGYPRRHTIRGGISGICNWHERRRRISVNESRTRPGVIEEVLRGDPSPRYRVRSDDGHETIYTPASGTLQARPRPESVKSSERLVVGRRRGYSSAGGHERA